MKEHHYGRLFAMLALSFVSMYVLMYSMVDTFDNVFASVNQLYMAGLMTAPMAAIELTLMRGMYPDKRRNALILAGSVLVGVALFVFIRQQTGVSDRQFLRSMIPHHAGAILMCNESRLTDREIQALCKEIVSGQRAEIAQMRAKLGELGSE
jgi:uncharacterized protein (DUF305 family)